MIVYNWVNGVLLSENDEMIIDILCKEWKFDGLVMFDWFVMYVNVFNVIDLEMLGLMIYRMIS